MSLTDVVKKAKSQQKKVRLAESDAPGGIFYKRWPTGLHTLDAAFFGGWPRACYCSMYGPPGVGKSAFGFRTIGAIQEMLGKKAVCAYLTLAGEMDRVLAAVQGVHLDLTKIERKVFKLLTGAAYDRKLIGKLYTQEVADRGGRAEGVLSLALELITSGEFQVVVLDEIGAENPKDWQTGGLRKRAKVGAAAMLLTRFGKEMVERMSDMAAKGSYETLLLGLSQVRAPVMGPDLEPDYKSAEPYELMHNAGARVLLRPGERESWKIENGTLIYKPVKWKTRKGRHGIIEGIQGEFLISPRTGIDQVEDLFTAARSLHVIQGGGGGFYTFDIKDEVRVRGGDNAKAALLKPGTWEQVEAAVRLEISKMLTEE